MTLAEELERRILLKKQLIKLTQEEIKQLQIQLDREENKQK